MPSQPAPAQAARPTPPVPAVLRSLAPSELPHHRRVRYQGDNLNVSLKSLVTSDAEALRATYGALSDLLAVFADPHRTDAVRWEDIQRWRDRPDLGLATVLGTAKRLGHDTLARDGRHGDMLAMVLHDVRGGGLTALLGRLQLLNQLPRNGTTLKMIFVLTRDHLKIMRNSFTGLDDARRESDRTPKAHSLALILEKWHEAVVGDFPLRPGDPPDQPPLRMVVDSRYEGALTECCLESAAIDRIFYNLAANACRHCAPGGRLEMNIFPVPTDAGQDLRFVLSNPVGREDAAVLRTLGKPAGGGGTDGGGDYLDALFTPAVSSTGSGYGLTVVAEFVAGAYGLADQAAAVAGRYVGARLDGDTFRVFFHWPPARSDLPPKLDDPHRPEQSLSD